MKSKTNDNLSDLLKERQLNDREVGWLWYYLKFSKDKNLDECALNGPHMRGQIARCLSYDESLKEDAEYQLETQLLPYEAFQWIQKDERQTEWLAKRAMKKASLLMLQPPFTTMTGKNLIIAIFDTWETMIGLKERLLNDLKQDWHEHLQTDRIFCWFKLENEEEKCELAWDWVEKNKPSLIRGKEPFTSHSGLLAFFDRSSATPDEKRHYVDTIKRRWSTQKHRKNTPHKKQYNFVLTNDVNATLDKLAEENQLSRTKVIEQLILREAERKLYLAQRDYPEPQNG